MSETVDVPKGEGWESLDTAPKDGTVIEGLYDEGPANIRWAERRQCAGAMDGGRIGSFGPGWEDYDLRLIMDPPLAWREEGWTPAPAPETPTPRVDDAYKQRDGEGKFAHELRQRATFEQLERELAATKLSRNEAFETCGTLNADLIVSRRELADARAVISKIDWLAMEAECTLAGDILEVLGKDRNTGIPLPAGPDGGEG